MKTTIDRGGKISIHALREEGDRPPEAPAAADRLISIHALREEGDPRLAKTARRGVISIHALREEGDPSARDAQQTGMIFLSTPSARRATPQKT